MDKMVTAELCEAKHGELMRSMSHIENKVDAILCMLNGNGKPGLRETQNDVKTLIEWKNECGEAKDTLIQTLARPALPVLYGLGLYLLWLALDFQFGG